MTKEKNLDEQFNHLMNLKNAGGKQLLGRESQEFKVNIRPNKDVAPAMFKPDPLLPGSYIANSMTIRALKKDIFTANGDFEDLEELTCCKSCKKYIDKQFWHFCPYCGESFN